MPIQRCQENGLPGFRWGESGKCYTYHPGNAKERAEARLKAELQGKAVLASGWRERKG